MATCWDTDENISLAAEIREEVCFSFSVSCSLRTSQSILNLRGETSLFYKKLRSQSRGPDDGLPTVMYHEAVSVDQVQWVR
jgi:hypothetical protein